MYVLELTLFWEARWNDDDHDDEEKEKYVWDGGIYGIKFLSNAINRAQIWDREWEKFLYENDVTNFFPLYLNFSYLFRYCLQVKKNIFRILNLCVE